MDRWATFDCYGTLIDWDGGVSAALRELWPAGDITSLLRIYHVIEPLVQHGRQLTYREVSARVLHALAIVRDLPLDARDRYHLTDTLPRWPAFPDVADALTAIRANGWRLAILSNTDPDLLDASRSQIAVPIDAFITAREAGSYKPAHGHWRAFFAQTGADPAGHVHVGASPFHDLVPAAEQGIRAVWINRTGERSDAPRAAELTDLTLLAATLNSLVPSVHTP
ncbi:MAG: HAD family hydrolase [Chloroflexota bacterium]